MALGLRTSQFFVGGGGAPLPPIKGCPTEVAPRELLGSLSAPHPTPPRPAPADPTTWSDRGAFKTLLTAHAQLFVWSWEFLRKKEETRRKLGKRSTFAAAARGVQGLLSHRSEEARVDFSSVGLKAQATPGGRTPVCAGPVGASGGVPGPRQGPGETTAPEPRGKTATSARGCGASLPIPGCGRGLGDCS